MANYLLGAPQDYIPIYQSFKPDLNYYSNILQASQSQYDQAHKAISNVYGTLLSSPMLREQNVARRDQFFKSINDNVKKISGLDLSQQQNIDAAMSVFRPIYEDKDIVNDMTKTRTLQNEFQKGERFRNCIDPDKCGGMYNPDSVKALNYWAEEFKNASDDEARNMSVRKFAPTVNLTKDAIKAAKDAGFNVSMDKVSGGYIVTDHNGHLLTGTEKQPGILPNYLYSVFSNDPRVMEMFETQAYVARKDFAKNNALNYAGGESEAEQVYLNKILHSSIQDLTKDAIDSKNMYDHVDAQYKILAQQIKQDGGVIADSPEDSLYQAYQKILQTRAGAEKHHETVQGMIQSAGNQVNLQAMRSRVDGIVAMNGFRTSIWNAANEYAMGTAKQEIKADPFALENVKFKHNLQEKDYDYSIWQKKQEYESKRSLDMLIQLGLTPEQASLELIRGGGGAKISAARIKELQKQGVGKPSTAKDVNAPATITPGQQIFTVLDNDQIYEKQGKLVEQNAGIYLREVAKTLRDKAGDKSLTDAQRQDATETLRNLFKGTRANVNGFMSGMITDSDLVESIDGGKVVNAYKNATNAAGRITSKYWNSPNLDLLKAEVDMQHQTLGNMNTERASKALSAIRRLQSEEGRSTKDAEDVGKQMLLYGSLLGDGGHIRNKEEAKNAFVKSASRYFQNDPDYIQAKTGQVIPGETAASKAAKFFDKGYDPSLSKYNNTYHDVLGESFRGNKRFSYEGGAPTVQKSMEVAIHPEQGLHVDTEYGNKVVDTIRNLPEGGTISYGGVTPQFVENFVSGLEAGDPQLTKYGYTVTSTLVPSTKNEDTGEFGPEQIVQKITPNPKYVKSLFAGLGSHSEKYDPNKDYSFAIAYPAGVDPTGFAQKTILTGVQGMMNLPGQALKYDDRPGNFTLKKKERSDGYDISGSLLVFDPKTGTDQYVSLDPKLIELSEKLDAEQAYLNVVSWMMQNHEQFYNQTRKDYIARYKQNAQSSGK